MEKEIIVEKLKEKGFRITKQRLTLLDIILNSECSCCKEIYYKASEVDNKIGAATVYRMINVLEEIGAIIRGNMYKITGITGDDIKKKCMIELVDDTFCNLTEEELKRVIKEGLKACGYINRQDIKKISYQ